MKLQNLSMETTWTSYMAAMGGVLKHCGYYNKCISSLMVETGMAFHFIVHNKLCPSSVTVYNWKEEHEKMLKRVGVDTEVNCVMGFSDHENQEELQHKAINDIKKSIDRGLGVVVWAPTGVLEFGIIKGYDDEDEIFFVSDVTGDDPDPLLYKNLGLSNVPILFYQIIKCKHELEEGLKLNKALAFALNEWNKEDHVDENYQCGRKGYDNLISSLKDNNFDVNGLSYIIAVYSDSKKCIKDFLGSNKNIRTQDDLISIFNNISENFNNIQEVVPFPYSGELPENKKQFIIDKLEESKLLEEEAMGLINLTC